jgi:hypothetical protein
MRCPIWRGVKEINRLGKCVEKSKSTIKERSNYLSDPLHQPSQCGNLK